MYVVFGDVIERARRLVENEDFWISDERTRNGDALSLSAREFIAVLADVAVQPLGKVFDKLFEVCHSDGVLELFLGISGKAVGNVVADTPCKQNAVLRYDGNKVPVFRKVEVFGRLIVDVQLTRRGKEQTDDEVHDGGLAGAGRADDGDTFSGTNVQIEVLNDVLVAAGILVADVFKADPSFDGGELCLSDADLDVLGAHDFRDRAQRFESGSDLRYGVNEPRDVARNRAEEGLIEYDVADSDHFLQGEYDAKDEAEDGEQIVEHPRPGAEIGKSLIQFSSRTGKFFYRALHGRDFLFFQPVRLCDGHHLEHCGKAHAHIFCIQAVVVVARADFFPEREGDRHVARNDEQEKEGDVPVFAKGDDDGCNKSDRARNKILHDEIEKSVDGVGIPQELGLNFSRLHILMVSNGQALQFSYDRTLDACAGGAQHFTDDIVPPDRRDDVLQYENDDHAAVDRDFCPHFCGDALSRCKRLRGNVDDIGGEKGGDPRRRRLNYVDESGKNDGKKIDSDEVSEELALGCSLSVLALCKQIVEVGNYVVAALEGARFFLLVHKRRLLWRKGNFSQPYYITRGIACQQFFRK